MWGRRHERAALRLFRRDRRIRHDQRRAQRLQALRGVTRKYLQKAQPALAVGGHHQIAVSHVQLVGLKDIGQRFVPLAEERVRLRRRRQAACQQVRVAQFLGDGHRSFAMVERQFCILRMDRGQ